MYKAPGSVVARSAELARVYPSIRRCAPGPAEGAWGASATKGGERAVRNNGGNKTNPEPPHRPTFGKVSRSEAGGPPGRGRAGRAPPAATVGKREIESHNLLWHGFLPRSLHGLVIVKKSKKSE